MSGGNHHQILDYINELQGVILEIGSSVNGGSTDFFGALVYNNPKIKFYTIDLGEDPYNYSLRLSERIPEMIAYHDSGENFLKNTLPNLKEKICYAFLDNFDYNIYEGDVEPNWVKTQKESYQNQGLKYTNEESANVHLEQTKLLINFVDKKCLIQFDDTVYLNNEFKGKGEKAALFLIAEGWTIVPCPPGSVIFKNF